MKGSPDSPQPLHRNDKLLPRPNITIGIGASYWRTDGGAMNLDLARWQSAITTVYHFLSVPLTIGLALLVTGMQTAWVRTDDDRYLRMTASWGKLFLINFAMGVVPGIVHEFQFGMNWSDYSRFVGDVFGAASTPYTLKIMTWVAVVFTPVVLAYQAWTFWVFRRRIGCDDIPAATGLPARGPEVQAL
jgi:cytochrome bd-type quinol oxidase subunit 2